MFNCIAAFTTAACALWGPPSVKIEATRNPATAPVKHAVFMVTGHHHSDATGFSVTGRVEGMVAGKRVTRPLQLTYAGREGVYGVLPQWASGQPWVLVFTVLEGGHNDDGVAEGMVRIGRNGTVHGIDYPMGELAKGIPWPRRVTPQEIEAALAAMAKS